MVRFGPYEVDFETSEVRKAGIKVRIQDQQLRILRLLVERSGGLVTREDLRQRIWPEGTFVEFDRSLNVAVAKLRQALNDSAERPLYIETVARKGYRFIAPVVTLERLAPADREGGTATAPVHRQPARNLRVFWPLSVLTLAACLLGVAALRWPRNEPDKRLVQLDLEVGETVTQPAISPDGATIALVAGGKLTIRRLDQTTITPLNGTEGASSPFFSPDGKHIGYFADSKLKRIAIEGGAPVTICDAAGERGGTWTEDGEIVASFGTSGTLKVVSASGGTPRPFTTMDGEGSDIVQHRRPRALPNSAGVLYVAGTGVADGALRLVSRRDGQPRTLVERASAGWYSSTGHLLFVQGNVLHAAPFDLRSLQMTGQPSPVLEGVMHDYFRGGDLDVSPAGTVVYRAMPSADRRLAWLRAGEGVSTAGLPSPGAYSSPQLSPDGKLLALGASGEGLMHIWVFDLDRRRMIRASFGRTQCCPVWSPDGEFIVFSAGMGIRWTRRDGSGPGGVIEGPEGTVSVPWTFSPDGRWLAFHRNQPRTGYDLFIAPVAYAAGGLRLGVARPLLTREGIQAAPAISPDGRWLAYASDESGRPEIYVSRLRGDASIDGSGVRVSVAGGRAPKWNRAGDRLFFRSLDDRVMWTRFYGGQERFGADTPVAWSNIRMAGGSGPPNYDVGADSDKVVAVVEPERSESSETHLRVILHFGEKLRQLRHTGVRN
ncbi:MAG: winged helix-turn-helix domain-containing protein [Bryobacteraceae bacterium]|nr:winged helix-turn-helix domain-containing protein [Bryobacteraceae bacterium]